MSRIEALLRMVLKLVGQGACPICGQAIAGSIRRDARCSCCGNPLHRH